MKAAIFTLNDDGPRLSPALAQEIGLSESILFLQIEFWIRTSTAEEHDGKTWTYQSVRGIQKRFPFWSVGTIQNTIKSLETKGLITVGNYNKRPSDQTRWFALNLEGTAKLESVRVGEEPFKNRTARSESEQAPFRNCTTLPESSLPETTTEKKSFPPDGILSPKEKEEIFQKIWEEYPKREGRKQALRHFLATVKTRDDAVRCYKALKKYRESDRVKANFIKNGSTWFNEWADWVEPTEAMMHNGHSAPTAPREYKPELNRHSLDYDLTEATRREAELAGR